MRTKKLLIANWKMNPKTLPEAKRLFLDVKKAIGKMTGARAVICPPAVFLPEIQKLYIGKRIAFGAQDVHTEKGGSHTGSLSAPMLRSVGASYAIVGHSERRAAGETNDDTRRKVRAALDERIAPVLCVGEQERDHNNGDHLHFIREEVETALRDIAKDELRRIAVAYEPIWAIGKSAADAMKPHDVHEMMLFVRKVLAEMFDRDTALAVPVLYGGSVEPENCDALIKEGGVNGFLVGHASLDATSFGDILACVYQKR